MEKGKLEKFLTSDPYQQFLNSQNYINQDHDPKYAFYEYYESFSSSSDVEKTISDDYINGKDYEDEYFYDYQDYRLPHYEDELGKVLFY